MDVDHRYELTLEWQGNTGSGTSGYRAYSRVGELRVDGKPSLGVSADTPFHGDADRWNPEDMLIGALAECHLLSYLYVATLHGVVVTAYTDAATGTMVSTSDGGGHFTEVTLHPRVTVADSSMVETARAIHEEASATCYIASSVNFPVRHEPTILVDGSGGR